MTRPSFRIVVPSRHTNQAYVSGRAFLRAVAEAAEDDGAGHAAGGMLDRYPVYLLAKAIKRSGLIERFGPPRFLRRSGRYDVVFVPEDQLGYFLPYGLTREVVPWCMDSWPRFDAGLFGAMRSLGVRRACFTQSAAVERCHDALPGIDACWMPESTSPELYDAGLALSDRPVSLMAFGRQHHGVADALATATDAGYLDAAACRERFPSMDDLRRGLGRARATLCFPRSATDASFSGGSETMTLRYLEAIASKTLVLGQSPRELVELFGFDPVVVADADNVNDLLGEVSRDPQRFQAHVDLAYARFLDVASAKVRARQFVEWLTTGQAPYADPMPRPT